MNNSFSFTTKLQKINEPGGWWYLIIPDDIHEVIKPFKTHGSLKIVATIDSVTWQCSIMPFGGGKHFIPVKKEIREQAHLTLGQEVSLSFVPMLP